MALRSKYIRFAKATTTGVQVITGVGFQGKALLLWGTHQTSLAATTAALMSFGITDGVLQSCRFIRHPGGEATTTSAQAEQTDHIVFKVSATSGATPTVQAAGEFGAFLSDGFTIDWTTNDSDADIFHAIVLGGDTLEVAQRAVKIDAATVDVTDLDFRPSSFIVLGGAADEFGAGDYNLGAPFGSICGFGFANAVDNTCLWTLGRGTGGAADNYRGDSDAVVCSIRVANLSGAAVFMEGNISARSDVGFTFTRTAISGGVEPIQHILALKGVRMAMATVTAPGSPGEQETTLPFEPDLLIAQSIGRAATTSAADMGLAMGAWQRADNEQGGSWIGGVDAANPSVYRRSAYEDLVLETRNATTGAVEVQAAVSASSPTSVTLDYVDVAAGTETIHLIALAATEPVRGSFVAGEKTTVRGPRAAAFGLDGNTNVHDEEGTFKVFGKFRASEFMEAPVAIRDSDPASPIDGTWWLVATGSPVEVSLRVRAGGVTTTFPVGTIA